MHLSRFLDETEGRSQFTFKYRSTEFHVMKQSILTRIKFLNSTCMAYSPRHWKIYIQTDAEAESEQGI